MVMDQGFIPIFFLHTHIHNRSINVDSQIRITIDRNWFSRFTFYFYYYYYFIIRFLSMIVFPSLRLNNLGMSVC